MVWNPAGGLQTRPGIFLKSPLNFPIRTPNPVCNYGGRVRHAPTHDDVHPNVRPKLSEIGDLDRTFGFKNM